jgi:hypothetical protein
MAAQTVRVKGLKELNRAFGQIEKDLQKEMRVELKRVAEPVAATARGKASRYGPKTAAGFVAGSRAGGAVVRQRVKRTTGLRPDFGSLLMREVLEPALAENEDEVVRGVERVLDRVITKAGF